MIDLALKVALAPALVVLATLVARRWGDAIGGMIIAVSEASAPHSSTSAIKDLR